MRAGGAEPFQVLMETCVSLSSASPSFRVAGFEAFSCSRENPTSPEKNLPLSLKDTCAQHGTILILLGGILGTRWVGSLLLTEGSRIIKYCYWKL